MSEVSYGTGLWDGKVGRRNWVLVVTLYLSRSFQFGGPLGQSCVISYCMKDTLDTLKFYTNDDSDDSESQPRRTFFWVHLLLSVLT